MLTYDDQNWIKSNYPRLNVTQDTVEGNIQFSATYNAEKNKFLILDEDTVNDIGGITLSDSYQIKIEERTIKDVSKLPALYVEGIDLIVDRHINTLDMSACLCSPFEEERFLVPNIDFKKYFTELIIPFLYGQSFYTKYNRWAWAELSHGPIGLLESYLKVADPGKTEECLNQLSRYKIARDRLLPLLLQKSEIKGHIMCLCSRNVKIRTCHKDAWMGLRQLHKDVNQLRITKRQQHGKVQS